MQEERSLRDDRLVRVPDPGDREDLELVERIKNGEAEAFERLVLKYQKSLYNTALRYVGDPHEAEDLTQEIFVKIYRSIATFKGNSRFFTWAYAVAMNHLRSRRKSFVQFVRGLTDFFAASDHDERFADPVDVEAAVEKKELLTALRAELAKLPEKYREILVLREINNLSYKEIMEILGLPMEAVKTRIHRGRLMLSGALEKKGF